MNTETYKSKADVEELEGEAKLLIVTVNIPICKRLLIAIAAP